MDDYDDLPTKIYVNESDKTAEELDNDQVKVKDVAQPQISEPVKKPIGKKLFGNPINEKEKLKTAQKCGQTTIQREIVVNLRRIARNLDIIIMLLVLFLMAWTTLNIKNHDILLSLFTGFATLILAFVQILIPKGRWAERALQKILKKNLDENYRTLI